MYKDFLDLKIYDKKFNNNEAIADIYKYLISEFETMSENSSKINGNFKNIDEAIKLFEPKEALDKFTLHWVAYFTYISRVHYLMNAARLGPNFRKIKIKEINQFCEQAESHIQSQISTAVNLGMKMHVCYLFFKFSQESDSNEVYEKLGNLYLTVFNSSKAVVDKRLTKSATKIAEKYSLEVLVKEKFSYHWNELRDTRN